MSHYSLPNGPSFKSNGSLSRINSLKIGAKVSHNSNTRARFLSQNYDIAGNQLLRLDVNSESDDKIERRWVSDNDGLEKQDSDGVSDLSSQGDDECCFSCRCDTAVNRDRCDTNLLNVKRKYYGLKEKANKFRNSVRSLETEMREQQKNFENRMEEKDLLIQKLKEKLQKVTGVSDLLAMPDYQQIIETQKVQTQKLFENDCRSRVLYLREIQKWNNRPFGSEPIFNPQESLNFMNYASQMTVPANYLTKGKESMKKIDEITQSSFIISDNRLEASQYEYQSSAEVEDTREREIKEFERALQDVFAPKIQLQTTEKDNAEIVNIKTQKIREIQLTWLKELLTINYILSKSQFDSDFSQASNHSIEMSDLNRAQYIDKNVSRYPEQDPTLRLNSEQRMVLGGLMKKLISQIPMARYSQDPAFSDLKRHLKKQGKYLTEDQIYMLDNAKKFQYKAHGQNLIDRLTHPHFDKKIFEQICRKGLNKSSVSDDEIRSIAHGVVQEINYYHKEKSRQKMTKTFDFEFEE